MALSVTASGTQTAAISTEHTLNAPTAGNVYQLAVSLANMANGDVVELRFKRKVLSSGSAEVVFTATYKDAQGVDGAVALSPPVPCPHGCTVTLKQTAGTGRNFDWSLEEFE